MEYEEFLERKGQLSSGDGFKPNYMPDFLYDFQIHLVDWAIRRGRCAIFADCGLGKTPMQLVWAENVARKTGKRVLIVTPLAVSMQTVREGEKFGIEAIRSIDGTLHRITITNYERLHYFNSKDFAGIVLDESSAIKHFTGKRQKQVTVFMKKIEYRLLCTATPSPNDFMELGTSSEALGHLGRMDMLNMFFRTEDGALHSTWSCAQKWSFKAHSEKHFWRWVCSWARACRKPSDIGFSDKKFKLPKLNVNTTEIDMDYVRPGNLLPSPSVTMSEEREELKATVEQRCKAAAKIALQSDEPIVIWCYLNDEGNLLQKLLPRAVQVKGGDSDEFKEKSLLGFASGDFNILITKPKIGGFGMNWQHCNRMTFFPSHSFEQYYQGVRRCWRFGQKKPVTVDIIITPGERKMLDNLRRKTAQSERMFDMLVQEMNNELGKIHHASFSKKERIPEWL